MLEERDGWHVVNVKDARWYGNAAFGKVCTFEKEGQTFPETGVHLYLLEPGKPNCRYHREAAQEGFLVLSGRCKLLVNDEERTLEPWDYVHCPAGVTHVFVGDGDGRCALLAIGARRSDIEIFYPENARAKACGAEAAEPTPEPKVAYADVAPRKPVESPDWPPSSG